MSFKNLNKVISPAVFGFTTFGYTMFCALSVAARSSGIPSDNLANAAVGGFLDLGLNAGFLVCATGLAALVGVSSYALYSTYKLINDKQNITGDECKKACIIAGVGVLSAICGETLVVALPVVMGAAIASERYVGK